MKLSLKQKPCPLTNPRRWREDSRVTRSLNLNAAFLPRNSARVLGPGAGGLRERLPAPLPPGGSRLWSPQPDPGGRSPPWGVGPSRGGAPEARTASLLLSEARRTQTHLEGSPGPVVGLPRGRSGAAWGECHTRGTERPPSAGDAANWM